MLFALVASEFPFDTVEKILKCEYKYKTDRVRTYAHTHTHTHTHRFIRHTRVLLLDQVPSQSLVLLLKDIFMRNPDLRLTVEQIRRHEWINQVLSPLLSSHPLSTSMHSLHSLLNHLTTGPDLT
jgi:hypothetical protein